MNKTKIHNVWFYKPKPEAIYCMAYNKNEKKLAISRADASIEIWNLDHSPFIERTITPTLDNFSVEGLRWCGNRLFSCGLHGLVIEYDLAQLSIKTSSVVTGGAAYCLDINPVNSIIAVGTEQGYINIFNINDDLLFEKFLDKQEGRIICLTFDDSGEFIASGSVDTIRIWSVLTGHCLHKMSTGRAEMKKETIVWCITMTKDLMVITGDSRGKLSFWDGKVGAHIESYQSHKADILTICMADDQQSLYCAGVDPNIINYVRIQVKDGSYRWVKSIQRKVHDHDVRALELINNRLYSAGVDGYLACSYHPPKTLLKYPPILQNPCITLARKNRLVLLRYPKHLEVWSLGDCDDNSENNPLELTVEPKKKLVIFKTSKSDSGQSEREAIICTSISPNGCYIMYSTQKCLRLYQFINEADQPKLIPVEFPQSAPDNPCVFATFLPNNNLVIAPITGGLKVISLNGNQIESVQAITKTDLEDTITNLISSPCGKYIVAADPKSNICVWLLNKKHFNYYCKLPKYHAPPTALAINPTNLSLVIAYSDNNIIEYDLKNRKLTEFSRNLTQTLPKQWFTRNSVIRNITFDPKATNIIILHDDSTIILLDKNQKETDSVPKIRKLDFSSLGTPNNDTKQHLITQVKKYKHLVYLGALAENELVAVEVNPITLIEQLPPCLVQNTFGRK